MKMNKKGFTLIELLAVIVILAIIALIATPIILNIINDSREKANQRSVEAFGKAIEETVSIMMADENYNGGDIICETDQKRVATCYENGNTGFTKEVTYSGNRILCRRNNNISGESTITIDVKSGLIVLSECYVGSSLKANNTQNMATASSSINDDNTVGRDNGDIIFNGSNPNNYVTFNGEKAGWRIVGVFSGKIKLVRTNPIGSYVYNTDGTKFKDVNSWENSSLKELLNGAYYNSTNGDCPTGQNATTPCDFSTTGLKVESRNMIAESVWYTGGATSSKIKVDEMYNAEQMSSWIGNVGLLSASDYGYFVSEDCKSDKNLYDYNSCKTDKWTPEQDFWTMTKAISDNNQKTFVAMKSGRVSDGGQLVYKPSAVYPAVYLKTTVKLVGGEGTETNPYQLSL